jgi:hypothetical protein
MFQTPATQDSLGGPSSSSAVWIRDRKGSFLDGKACASCTKAVTFGQKLCVQDRLVSTRSGLTFAERHNVTSALAVVRCLLHICINLMNEIAKTNGAFPIAIL